MRILDLILDRISETQLFEMAFRRKEALSHALHLSDQISMHIIKVLMYGQCEHTNQWCQEIDGWLRGIQRYRLKTNSKPLPYRDLLYLLHEGPLEHVSEVQDKMNEIFADYPSLIIVQPDAAQIHKQLLELYSRICLDISQEKFKTLTDYL